MAVLTCPLCGSAVRVPRVETNTRYLCKKCHAPFHVNKAGTAVVGEPPDIEVELAEMKQKLQETVSKVPVKKIVTGVSALVLAVLVWYVFFGPADSLKSTAEEAAHALADNDPGTLKSFAVPGTQDDVIRWFDDAHSRLVQARGRWHGGKEEAVEVHVGQEDPKQRTGSAGISIHPAVGALDVSLADPAAATAAADAPFDVETIWSLNRWGHWKLDGRATYAKSRGTPTP